METITLPSWSSLAWRGFASVVFGILALAWPGVTLAALTLLFGAYAFADGVFALIVASRRGRIPHRWLFVLDGVCGIGAAAVTIFWPGLTLLVLIYIVAARAVLIGAFQIGAAVGLRRAIPSPVLLGISGVASLLFGLVTAFAPAISAFVLVTILGVYSMIFGVALVALALRMRRDVHRVSVHAPAT